MLQANHAFATFWAGQHISAYEAACLASFIRRGAAMTVYSYGPIDNLPEGVVLRNAGEVVDERFVDGFKIKGKPSLSHFSDLFRYRLFQQSDTIWADSDMYLLRSIDMPLAANVLAREDADTLCGAIMRLDRDDPALDTLVSRTEAIAQRELIWGATGPKLLTAVFGPGVIAAAHDPALFFPVHYDAFWKVFLPEYRDECEALCEGAYTLHLWNNIVTKVGVWKDVLPPEGSFLHALFTRDGMAPLFQGTFPADVMRIVIDNYRMRLSGNFADVSKLARLALPGLKRRTVRQLDRVRDRIMAR